MQRIKKAVKYGVLLAAALFLAGSSEGQKSDVQTDRQEDVQEDAGAGYDLPIDEEEREEAEQECAAMLELVKEIYQEAVGTDAGRVLTADEVEKEIK